MKNNGYYIGEICTGLPTSDYNMNSDAGVEVYSEKIEGDKWLV